MAIMAAAVMAVGGVAAAAMTGAPSAPVMGAPVNFDHSGWNVAFPGARIDSARSESGAAGGYMQYLLIGGVFLILWKALKKS